jgi:hypothetical protein
VTNHVKNNLMDIMHLLLKAQVLASGKREIRMSKSEVMRAENFDLRFSRSRITGEVILQLVEGDKDKDSAIVIPAGPDSPLITF